MGVAAEVVEDLFGTGEWPLRVDDPFGLAGWAEVLGEAPGFAEGRQSAGEAEISGVERARCRRQRRRPTRSIGGSGRSRWSDGTGGRRYIVERDLTEVIEDRAERASTLMASQLPVTDWHAVIGDLNQADAIFAPLLHDAHRIEFKGRSLRRTHDGPNTRPPRTT